MLGPFVSKLVLTAALGSGATAPSSARTGPAPQAVAYRGPTQADDHIAPDQLLAKHNESSGGVESAPPPAPTALAGLSSRPPDEVERARIGLLIEGYAKRERRERLLRGSLRLGIGAVQFSIGMLMLTRLEKFGRTVPLSGWMNVGVGSYGMGRGIARLIFRGPLEKLGESYAYHSATGHRPSTADLQELEAKWSKAVKRARLSRYIAAGINLAAGVGLLGYGGYMLFAPERYFAAGEDQYRHPDPTVGEDLELIAEGRYIVGASLSVTAMLYIAEGLYSAILPKPVEASWSAYRSGHRGLARRSRLPSVGLTRGGFTLSYGGQF